MFIENCVVIVCVSEKKIREYETFLSDVLLDDLKKVLGQRGTFYKEVSDLQLLKDFKKLSLVKKPSKLESTTVVTLTFRIMLLITNLIL